MTDHRRASDRWVTPAVVCTFVVVAGGIVALLIAVVGYLTVRGYDPAPILDLVAKLVTAVGALGTLVLQLVGRKTQTKIERNTGPLVDLDRKADEIRNEVRDVADALYPADASPSIAAAPRTAHVYGAPPVPPPDRPARC